MKSSHPYSVHPSIAMAQSAVAKLKEKTGRSMDEWVSFIEKSGPDSVDARAAWLKKEHGLGTNYASWLARRSAGEGWDEDDPAAYLKLAPTYVDEMYAGPKAALRPLYEKLLALGLKIGKQARACPCKTMVPLFRNHVFAQIKPATNKRIDMGFALGDMKPTGRLIDTGGFAKKDRITHRIPIASPGDIDAEVARWLKAAYDRDG